MAPQNTTKTLLQEQDNDVMDEENEGVLRAGIKIASPLPGEEVVITGMAGRFPDSDDIYQYRYNLMNKVDMVSADTRRWDSTHPEIPQRTGKINFIEKFDSGFFGIHYRQAMAMDPMCRQILERAFEAVMDAGIHPDELRGTNTGVFIGACFSESEKTQFYDKLETPNFGITGCTRSMQAQRISYYLGLEGPSYVIDTACSSSLYALEHAYRAIRMGKCDSALVGGASLCLHPIVSLQFSRLGVLSSDGSCKSFDADADGYARSEAVSVVYLQKMKDAKRIYAQILHAKTNCDGYKEQSITYPSGHMQKKLLNEVYQEASVDPATIDFLEAHATGTKVGDPEEIMAMDEVFCANREKPLLVGSIKSNLGHTEPVSGMCTLVKVLLGMENDCLMPNINYAHPREGAEALEKGRMVVVTEKIPWPKDGTGLAAINSFGFGGANCHVLLKRFLKEKINHGQPRDELPRLVCASGRTEQSVEFIWDDISGRPFDAEFARILHDSFSNDIKSHAYRGYIILSKAGELSRSSKRFEGIKQPLCLTFAGSSQKWLKVGTELFAIPLFAATIQRIHNILIPRSINVSDIITKGSSNDVISTVIGNVAIQLALVNILKTLGFSHDYVIGYSTGELVAGYADDALTLEQAILIAYHISQCLTSINIDTVSYQVELDKNKLKLAVSNGLEIVAHNSEDNYTISGHPSNIAKLVEGFKNQGVVVKEVESSSTLHSKHLAQICPKLLQNLKEVVPKPKQRSERWISTSIQSITELSKYASAEYFLNHFLTPILFNEATLKLPHRSIMMEIGSELPKIPKFTALKLVDGNDGKNDIHSLLCGLGGFYEFGYNFKLEKLYPKIQWPVSLNTPMVSPLIKWNHTENWFVALYRPQERIKSGERVATLNVKESDWAFIAGHIIDGRNLFPATGYLVLVWETFSMLVGLLTSEMQIVFENVKFHRATPVIKEVMLIITIQKGTGYFEVADIGETVVSGRVFAAKVISEELSKLPLPIEEEGPVQFSAKDIYKELKLRGYHYMGDFRGLKGCDLSTSIGKVKWTGNWIPFMDNMLQLKLLQEDTRNLYVPTGIERLVIDAIGHIRYIQQFGENPVVPVYIHKHTGIIKSGSIEIRGLHANSIPRRKQFGEPVLESYKFVPFQTELEPSQSVRVNTQIFLENNYGIRVRSVELIDAATKEGKTPLGPLVHQAFSDIPLIQSEVLVLSENPLELTNVTVEDKKLTSESHTCAIVVASNVLGRPEIKEQALNALKENGVIISREDLDFDLGVSEKEFSDIDILSVHTVDTEKFVLLRKAVEFDAEAFTVIDVSNHLSFDWLPTLQSTMKNDEKVIVLAQNVPLSGVLGFSNCLRREPGGMNIKCVFVNDVRAPKFDINNEFYSKQLKKGLAFNVFKNGKWGTYRHLLLEKAALVQRQQIFNNVTVRGDMSSLRWIEGPLTTKSILPPENILVHVYYTAVNFRDIMTASGRISNDVVTRDRMEQLNVQGFEFAGRDSSGRRVVGMRTSGALASMVVADCHLIFDIPDYMSMEEAVTIPVTYATVSRAVITIAQIKPGDSILIHAGSGGVGQAAIYVAQYYKCKIFTTVGSQEKRDFIRETFPDIPESHIGNSRDTSFEQMIMMETNGRGVDIVLNSLSEEKLQASLRCLAPGGRFLEIGKFDLANNNTIGTKLLAEGRSFHGVMLDAFFTGPNLFKAGLFNGIIGGLVSGMIKPLNRTVFQKDEVERAFRYMAGGKHIGKIVIKLRDEEPELEIPPEVKLFEGLPRFYGNPDHCYIIAGGLGGFGLELADWLVIRGAKKLVLISRVGLTNGYQASRIRIWKTYGVTTVISTADITTEEGCVALMKEATELGPVEGIFNLAAVLKDAILENQNEENYMTSLLPKAIATQHLDSVSRKMCPNLLYFVVFSSVVCGRGNAGQTNYGMANSIMERICEKRKEDGYPAVAIQWGAIGEVGLVADMQEIQMEIEIGGTLQQRVTSCLDVMDTFLKQDEPVVASMVVAEKRGGSGGADNIVDAVKNILGIRDLKTISLHSSLSELGMDSMMAVEIKQTLEREYDVFLTAQDIRGLTFARLKEIADEKGTENENQNEKNREGKEKLPEGVCLLLRSIGDEVASVIPMLRLTSLIKEKFVAPKVFLLPGIEGMATTLEPLAANLASHAICLQFTYSDNPESTVEDLARSVLPHIQENLSKNTPFTLVGYSFGALVALELAALLEAEGRIGRVVLIDGAPALFKELIIPQLPEKDYDTVLQTLTLLALMQLYMPLETAMSHKAEIYNCKSFEERVDLVLSLAPEDIRHSPRYQRQVCMVSYKRMNAILIYQPAFRKLKSMVKLFKPSHPTLEGFDEDYKLQNFCENPIEITVYDGNHLTIVKNPQISYDINNLIDSSSVYLKQSIMKEKPEIETWKEVKQI